ncbi:hypothetical protein ACFL6I_13710 [candidate division KSB1 bacterium]
MKKINISRFFIKRTKSMINNAMENKKHIGLARHLGLFDSAMLIVGMVIGSGVFLTTGIIAQYIPSAVLTS